MARILSMVGLRTTVCLAVAILLGAGAVNLPAAAAEAHEPPRTKAEDSNYTATSSHAEVMAFCKTLAASSNSVRLLECGQSEEGRPLPLLVLSRPAVASPEEARRSGKPVVLCLGNIHGGEVCGKEALLMLARDLVATAREPLLDELILLIVPIMNADGNERMAETNRTDQNGPEKVGARRNASGLDLNRDFVKLEAPETRAVVRVMTQWDPMLMIDTHTTDGSYHRYILTYDGPRHPATDPALASYVREKFLPEVTRRVKKEAGHDTFFYGNFEDNKTRWETFPALARYSTHYFGLRQGLSILSEAYVHAPFQDRVLATRDFVLQCLRTARDQKKEIGVLLSEARGRSRAQAQSATNTVALRSTLAPYPDRVQLKGFEETVDGKVTATSEKRDYDVEFWASNKVTASVALPLAYVFASKHGNVVTNLQRHGIEVEVLREDLVVPVETYHLSKTGPAAGTEKSTLVGSDIRATNENSRLDAGSYVVRGAQTLGPLAAVLLEPASEDNLVTAHPFSDAVTDAKPFPVRRLRGAATLLTTKARPLAENRKLAQPLTFEAYSRRPNFTGSPTRIEAWLPDGKHLLQVREGVLCRVNADTGAARPLFSSDKVAKALARLPALGEKTARTVSRRTRFQFNTDHTAALFEHDNDVYFFQLDGSQAKRVTHTPGAEELISFSPDGKFVAFVRADNLYVVDLETLTERALTTDGTGDIRNGKADWVYFEELYNRDWKAYWWSPDSSRIAFHRFDDTALPVFHTLDTVPLHGRLETMRHPKAGDPNPLVKLGVVSAAGGDVAWADLNDYLSGSYLFSRVGWSPDGAKVYFHVQDRAQTWLDFNTWDPGDSKPRNHYREKTQAWVDDLGPPQFLENGDLLILSARSGWQHLYRFHLADGHWSSVTTGEWQVRKVHRVDQKANWVYFSASRDSSIAENLYRCHLDGSVMQRLTKTDGNHRITFPTIGDYFVTHDSDYLTPEQVRLHRTNGRLVRTLDLNPVYTREEFAWGTTRLLQIKTRDGFPMDALLTTPPDFDPSVTYPVWMMTYGGPKNPTVRDSWSASRGYDQMLSQLGLVVLRVDPRSASDRSALSAWTAYRQLGVQELADLTDAVHWLRSQPYVDPSRIGLSGHSYGGFMTAYALTHSDLFAAGIAGAPVTDWRFYDSIYTERFMDTPQNNRDGYQKSSVVNAASRLHGRLLLLHGMIDDNVHLQNATALIDALQKAGKEFELMFYPGMRHGLSGGHYDRLLVEFIRKTFQLDKPAPGREAEASPGRRSLLEAGQPH